MSEAVFFKTLVMGLDGRDGIFKIATSRKVDVCRYRYFIPSNVRLYEP